MATHRSVEQYLEAQSADARSKVELIRSAVLEADPRLVETIKWNSPNFVLDGADRLTVNVGRGDIVRLVLHLGTAVEEVAGAATRFDGDPGGLLTWHSDIRASLLVDGGLDRDAAIDVIRAWLAFGG